MALYNLSRQDVAPDASGAGGRSCAGHARGAVSRYQTLAEAA